MQTCSTCGSLLMPQKKDGKSVLSCMRCGTSKQANMKLQEKAPQKQKVDVVDASNNDMQHPLTDKACEKCGHPRSHYWIQQTRASDEAATRFYKCEKCKHTWREY